MPTLSWISRGETCHQLLTPGLSQAALSYGKDSTLSRKAIHREPMTSARTRARAENYKWFSVSRIRNVRIRSRNKQDFGLNYI